jgi:hypothetical protein
VNSPVRALTLDLTKLLGERAFGWQLRDGETVKSPKATTARNAILSPKPLNLHRWEPCGGSGPLSFRPNARKNLILVTDEDSDQPFYVEIILTCWLIPPPG